MMYNRNSENRENSEKVIQISRVSKKTKGGNRIGFTALVVVGDKKGKVGVGLGKAPDVLSAIKKGTRLAKKRMISVVLKGRTIPHRVYLKKGAAKILIKPAPRGSGVIAGGAVRTVMESAGIMDVVSKILGSRNKINNVYATIEALSKLKNPRQSFKPNEDKKPLKAVRGLLKNDVKEKKKKDANKAGKSAKQKTVKTPKKAEVKIKNKKK